MNAGSPQLNKPLRSLDQVQRIRELSQRKTAAFAKASALLALQVQTDPDARVEQEITYRRAILEYSTACRELDAAIDAAIEAERAEA